MKSFLHSVANFNIRAFSTRDSALHEEQSTLNVRANDFKVLNSPALDTIVSGHFLALEDFTWVLALTGRTVRPVRDRHTVRGAKTAKVPALHRTGKTFTDGHASNVDFLTRNKMVGLNFSADIWQSDVSFDTEL